MKIIFLDFTGTMDVKPIEEYETFNVIPKEVSRPQKGIKKWLSSMDNFYSNVSDTISFKSIIDNRANKISVKYLKQLCDKTGAKIVFSSTRRYAGWKKCAEYIGLPNRYFLGGKQFGVTPEIEHSFTYQDNKDYKHAKPPKYKKPKYDYSNYNHKSYDEYMHKDWTEYNYDNDYWEDNYVDNYDTDNSYTVVSSYKQRQEEIEEWFKQYKKAKLEAVDSFVILDDDPITSNILKDHWVESVQKNGFKEKEYKQALAILNK